MSTEIMAAELEALRKAVQVQADALKLMSRAMGTRLTRPQMCERLGVCGKTLTTRLRAGDIPKPGADGKWLLEEVIDWEIKRIALHPKLRSDV